MRSEVQDLGVYLDVNLLLCTSDNLKWKFFEAFLTEKNLKRTYSNYPSLCAVVGGTQMQHPLNPIRAPCQMVWWVEMRPFYSEWCICLDLTVLLFQTWWNTLQCNFTLSLIWNLYKQTASLTTHFRKTVWNILGINNDFYFIYSWIELLLLTFLSRVAFLQCSAL